MIAPMKKIYIVVQKKDNIRALDSLGNIGIVHLEHERIPISPPVHELKDQIQMIDRIAAVLNQYPPSAQQFSAENWNEKAQAINDCLVQRHQLKEQAAKRAAVIQQWEPWGNFDPEDIHRLSAGGVSVAFLEISSKGLFQIPKEAIVEIISRTKNIVCCVVIADRKIDLPFRSLAVPAMGLQKMRLKQQEDRESIRRIEQKIQEFCQYLNSFNTIREKTILELKFQEALAGMGESEDLVYVKGFCPLSTCEILKKTAQKEKWGLLIEDPAEQDQVPTLLRNPRWVSVIQPVFSMMNVLPGYSELDISMFFLLFFSVFFGILVGDVGYGFLFLLLTVFAHVKFRKTLTNKAAIYLLYILSSCAIVWGVLTGTYFGQAWLSDAPLKPLMPWLTNNKNVQMLCFLIGAIHLTVAHVWRGINKMPHLKALSELGWIALLWGSFFLARLLILGDPIPALAKALFFAGPAFVIFFSQPNKNILKTVGSGLGDLLLSLVNMFTDVVSYIRLFAVGLATVAVADVFNQMAAGIGMGSIWSGLIMVLILVGGHLLNFVLCAMAILVHGIRLNVLEFSSHLNMEWRGVAFDPLRKTKELKI